jgi:hypothetical protein
MQIALCIVQEGLVTMDIRRDKLRWQMRWTAPPNDLLARGDTRDELCARCGSGGGWITVPDLRPLPPPVLVYGCRRCGTTTKYADFPRAVRRLAD